MDRLDAMHRRPGLGIVIIVVITTLAVSACSDASDSSSTTSTTAFESVMVPRDVEAPEFVVNITMTDGGYEPDMVFVPAGRPIRLVLRNRGETEHHYRVVGLIPAELRWRMEAQLDDYDLDSGEFADTYVDDIEHVLHHLAPTFVPFKEESPAGVRPIGNEVHGYAPSGKIDTVIFYALATGKYDVMDALYPEITGSMIVFDPRPSGLGS